MCLDSITKRDGFPKQVKAWKVFAVVPENCDDDEPGLYGAFGNGGPYEVGKRYKAEVERDSHGNEYYLDAELNGSTYAYGFHCFVSRKAARELLRFKQSEFRSTVYVIKRVLLSGVFALGPNTTGYPRANYSSHPCYVAKYMTILREKV